MAVLSIDLEDDALSYLKELSVESRRNPADIAAEAIRRYLNDDLTRRALRDPSLQAMYRELESEDLALAEAGIGEYSAGLVDADRSTPT